MSIPANFAASRKVNPPNAAPKLTAEQVWKGLEIKAREPARFIPFLTSSKIVKESENGLTREVTFNGGPPMTEDITIHPSAILYFNSPEKGMYITNVLSYDEDGELVLTFSFAGGIPGRKPDEELPPPEELNKSIGGGVEHCIRVIRGLVEDGTI